MSVQEDEHCGDSLDANRPEEYSAIPDQTHGWHDPERSKSRTEPRWRVTCESGVTHDIGRTSKRVAVSVLEYAPTDVSLVGGISTPATGARNGRAVLDSKLRVKGATGNVDASRTDNRNSTI